VPEGRPTLKGDGAQQPPPSPLVIVERADGQTAKVTRVMRTYPARHPGGYARVELGLVSRAWPGEHLG
jgi:hypothetical protein